MRDTSPAARAPRDNESRRAADDDTWFEECARRPIDEPVIVTIPLPDKQ